MKPPDKCNGKAQHAHRTHTLRHTRAHSSTIIENFSFGDFRRRPCFVWNHIQYIHYTLAYLYQLAFLRTEHHMRTNAQFSSFSMLLRIPHHNTILLECKIGGNKAHECRAPTHSFKLNSIVARVRQSGRMVDQSERAASAIQSTL